MIKGKLTIDINKPVHTCFVCNAGALYNVKNIKSYNEAGCGGGTKITPLPDNMLNLCFMLLNKYNLSARPSDRTQINGYRFHQAVRNELNKSTFNVELKSYNDGVSTEFSYHCDIFSRMLRKLVKVDKKAYYRQVASYNKKIDQRNAKPRTYPTCWYVCSEECLNMLILQKS